MLSEIKQKYLISEWEYLLLLCSLTGLDAKYFSIPNVLQNNLNKRSFITLIVFKNMGLVHCIYPIALMADLGEVFSGGNMASTFNTFVKSFANDPVISS